MQERVMQAPALTAAAAAGPLLHRLRAMRAVVGREVSRFLRQPARLGSALVRPLLWFVVFAAGFHNAFGVAIIPPYETYVEYKVYLLPGLLGMIALFNGMQGSLSMVYDRETGMMRLLLTAPLPRAWLLAFKLAGTTFLSVLQMVVFLAIAVALGAGLPALRHLPLIALALCASAAMLTALGLVLSVYIRQMENFAGAMNFVIFPMFFLSSALFPLWKIEESGALVLHALARFNPFTHAVEMIRFALHGQVNLQAMLVVLGCGLAFFLVATLGYDPQRGFIRNKRGG